MALSQHNLLEYSRHLAVPVPLLLASTTIVKQVRGQVSCISYHL